MLYFPPWKDQFTHCPFIVLKQILRLVSVEETAAPFDVVDTDTERTRGRISVDLLQYGIAVALTIVLHHQVQIVALLCLQVTGRDLASPSLAYLMLFSTKVCTERIGTCQSSTSGSTVISLVTGRPVTCF